MQNQKEFKVSVIIPFYNAEKYLEQAVLSAVNLDETGEVILIDDLSTDSSAQIANALACNYRKVRIVTSSAPINMGPAYIRNEGIVNALFPFIAFLDADDYYLPNRFFTDKTILSENAYIDGVYGCTHAFFETEKAKQLFFRRYESFETTFSQRIPSNRLYKALLFGGAGRFHTSAVTIKKSLLEKVGLFNVALRYAEDSELWLKCSLAGTLVAGQIDKPVSIRRVHENNSIHNIEKAKLYVKPLYQNIFEWGILKHFSFEVKNDLFRVLYHWVYDEKYSSLKVLSKVVKTNPRLIFTSFLYKKIYQVLVK